MYRPRVVEATEENVHMGGVRLRVEDTKDAEDGRAIDMSTGLVGRASGSAQVMFGNTKVRCSVHGPRAVKRPTDFSEQGKVACYVRLAPFSQYEEQGISKRDAEIKRMKRERELSDAVQRAIEGSIRTERFPKSLVEIHVLVLSDDGGAQAAAVTCASLALANGGIELLDLVPCVSVGLKSKLVSGAGQPNFIIDPDAKDLAENCSSQMVFALMPASQLVTDLTIEGAIPFDLAGESTKVCFESCVRLHRLMKGHLISMVQTTSS